MAVRLFEDGSILERYARYRKRMPEQVPRRILDLMSQHTSSSGLTTDLLVDVGCGPGNSTEVFAPFFKRVVGLDVSPAAVELASKRNSSSHTEFRVSAAESLPIDSSSVDLLTAISCAHFFDYAQFCAEADRVLKPNAFLGIIANPALLKYDHVDGKIKEALNDAHQLLTNDVQQHYEMNVSLEHFFENLKLPFPEITREIIVNSDTLSLDDIMNIYRTHGAAMRYHELNPEVDILEIQRKRMLQACGVSESAASSLKITVQFEWYITLCKKPGHD